MKQKTKNHRIPDWRNSIRLFQNLSFIGILIVSMLFFARPEPVWAQDQGLTFTASAAFEGNYKYGEWIPIWVEVTNAGGDLDAAISVEVTASQGTLVFETPVSLPSGAHKRLPVYVLPNNFSRELAVTLKQDGKVLTSDKVTVHPQPNLSYVVGLLSPQRGALSLLNGISFPGQQRPKVLIDLSLDELPDRAEGLSSFDLLVLNNMDTSILTPDQTAALAGWVKQGGRLIIGGGAGSAQTLANIPDSLLPISLQGTVEVGAKELAPISQFAASDPIQSTGPFILSKAKLNNSRVLSGSDSQPLIVEKNWGVGAIDFVAFDLTGIPLNGWPGTQTWWETLLGASRAYSDSLPYDMSYRQMRANSLSYPLSNIPSLDLPSIQGVGILLLIYILVVGPLNYFFLRWRKRLQWAWVTIPALTAIFTAGAFLIGYSLRGNDLIVNKIALVELGPDGNASVNSYMGLFSPQNTSYEINIDGEGLVSPMSGYDNNVWNSAGGAPASGGQMTFIQGRPSTVKGLSVNQWAMQSFMSEGVWQDFGKISGSLTLENETLVGKIKNNTQYALSDVVVAIQNRFVRLGEMAPGEEKAVNLGLSSLQSDRFNSPLSYRLYMENQVGPIPRDIEQKSNIVSSVFENGMMSKLSSRFPAPGNSYNANAVTILGWMKQAPPNVEVKNNSITQTTTALVYTTLNYSLPEKGRVAIPAGMLSGEFVDLPQDAGVCSTATSIHMGRGQATIRFSLPKNQMQLSIDTLKLAYWNDSGNQWQTPQMSLYNWQNETWTALKDPIQGTNIVRNADAYVNSDGTVQVQIESPGDNTGCYYFDLGLEGTITTTKGG